LAFNWVSVSEAGLDAVGVELDAVVADAAGFRASSTRFCVFWSTLSVALALETCTAGDSPKKLGKV
jgi:hypothetical protein